MGIRGLTSFCHEHREHMATVIDDLCRVTLAVDFNGFLHHICSQILMQVDAEAGVAIEWLLLGGNAARLKNMVDRWLCALEAKRIKLVFVTDPPRAFAGKNDRKQRCRDARATTKVTKIRQLETMLFANDPENGALRLAVAEQCRPDTLRVLQETNGVFPFARETLRAILMQHKVEITTAPREADETLAQYVRMGKAYAILAADSDFFCMKDVRYVPFKDLTIDEATGCVAARVFYPERIAEALQLQPQQLVDLSILCRNDFTAVLDDVYNLGERLGFPPERVQFLEPSKAAEWILWNTPLLEDPQILQIEDETPGLLSALFEIYAFFGFGKEFLAIHEDVQLADGLNKRKMLRYRKMLDDNAVPSFAVDLMELKIRSLPSGFDPIGVHRRGKNLVHLMSSCRPLCYHALNVLDVQERYRCPNTGKARHEIIKLRAIHSLSTLLSVQPKKRTERWVDRALRDIMYAVVKMGDKECAHADAVFDSLSANKVDPIRTVVNAMLAVVNADSSYFGQQRLFTPSIIQMLLLSSIISIKLQDDILMQAKALDTPVEASTCAAVHAFMSSLQIVSDTRRILVEAPHSLYSLTLFSSEIFMRVLAAMDDEELCSPNGAVTTQHVARVLVDLDVLSRQQQVLIWSSFEATYSCMTQLLGLARCSPGIVSPVDSNSTQGKKKKGTKANKGTENSQTGSKTSSASGSSKTLLMPSSVAKRNGVNRPSTGRKTRSSKITTGQPSLTTKMPAPSLRGMMKTLPVFQHREEIIANVERNQITIIQGETGCGKSTSVPQFLLDTALGEQRNVNIYVTQPRRIAAIELASTVAKMREQNQFDEDGIVGHTVGYRIGQKQCVSSQTQITYVTTGYMVERLIHDEDALSTITHLVLDEVHERSLEVDFLLMLLYLRLRDNPGLRLVIMSATMDATVLFKYFTKGLQTKLRNKKALFGGSKLHPVLDVHLEKLCSHFPSLEATCAQPLARMNEHFEYLVKENASSRSELAIKPITKIHEHQLTVVVEIVRSLLFGNFEGSRCVLVFLPGINSINVLYEGLSNIIESARFPHPVKLLVLHSGIELEHQREAFDVFEQKSAKIILSTNIAESSVTIPDVTHVINCGVERQIQIPNDSSAHVEVLMNTWCSRASAKQRSGRAGRLRAGVAYHLFPERFRKVCMHEYTVPEILRKPLDRIILQMKGKLHRFGVPSELFSKALDSPDQQHIEGAYGLLAHFGAVDSPKEDVAQITQFGAFVCNFPLSLELCRMLLTSMSVTSNSKQSTAMLLHTIILVSVLAVPDIFVMPSWYHCKTSSGYMADMKRNLKAKLGLDGGLWSEPLSIWRHYVDFLAAHQLYVRPKADAMCFASALSYRRYQTLNFLISDICQRLVELKMHEQNGVGGLLTNDAIDMVKKLNVYASTQRVDESLLAFATAAGEPAVVDTLRFLLVANYEEDVLVAEVSGSGIKREEAGELDAAVSSQPTLDRIQLSVARQSAGAYSVLTAAQRASLFGQLTLGGNSELIQVGGNASEIVLKCSDESEPTTQATRHSGQPRSLNELITRPSFAASLLYYVRDQQYPVDIGAFFNSEVETSIRCRVKSSKNLLNLSWSDKVGNNVMLGGRSLFGLPLRDIHESLDEQPLRAIACEKLLTGDEMRMVCSRCTLLPPNLAGYYPALLLLTARHDASVWLYVDDVTNDIVAVRVNGRTAVMPPKKNLSFALIDHVNRMREAMSKSIHGVMGDVRMEDVLELCQDTHVQWKTPTRGVKHTYSWQNLRMDEAPIGDGSEIARPRFPRLSPTATTSIDCH